MGQERAYLGVWATENLRMRCVRLARSRAMSAHAIARGAGIDVASLLRFMNRQRTLTLPSAGRLAAFLGLELRPTRKG